MTRFLCSDVNKNVGSQHFFKSLNSVFICILHSLTTFLESALYTWKFLTFSLTSPSPQWTKKGNLLGEAKSRGKCQGRDKITSERRSRTDKRGGDLSHDGTGMSSCPWKGHRHLTTKDFLVFISPLFLSWVHFSFKKLLSIFHFLKVSPTQLLFTFCTNHLSSWHCTREGHTLKMPFVL